MIKKKEAALRRLRSKNCRWDDYKNYSPELQKDPEICLAAAENDGSVLMFIPEECRTRERYAKEQSLSRDEEHLSPRAVSCVDSNSAKDPVGVL